MTREEITKKYDLEGASFVDIVNPEGLYYVFEPFVSCIDVDKFIITPMDKKQLTFKNKVLKKLSKIVVPEHPVINHKNYVMIDYEGLATIQIFNKTMFCFYSRADLDTNNLAHTNELVDIAKNIGCSKVMITITVPFYLNGDLE